MEPEATSSRSPGTADRIGLALLLLAGAATLIVLGSVRHWYWHPDEHDNMAVGWLLSRGHVLYRDVFSHHMPLPYLLVEAEMRISLMAS